MSFIRTFTGKEFYPLEPRINDICIEDIAHALSNLCRFTGHTKHFYSVAQHSVYVSRFISYPGIEKQKEYELYGLLHDASEAYICDISRPLKKQDCFFEYKLIEHKLQMMIYERFGLKPPDSDVQMELKMADNDLLELEGAALMNGWKAGNICRKSTKVEIESWIPEFAKLKFLGAFKQLVN